MIASGTQHPPLQAFRDRVNAWWDGLPAAPRMRAWPLAFAVFANVALLLGFHQVVHQAVQKGEVLRTSANRAEATQRCQGLAGAQARERCVDALDTPARGHSKATPPNTASVSNSPAG